MEPCLSRAVYAKDTDAALLLREIDTIAEKAVTALSGEAAVFRVLLLTVTGLVHPPAAAWPCSRPRRK